MICKHCGAINHAGATYCKNCKMALNVPEESCGGLEKKYNMTWHKVMINFVLIISAIFNLSDGTQMISGVQYGENVANVYALYSGLHVLDIICGVLIVAIAVFCIYVRFELAKFKRGAPKKLTILYVLICILPQLYSIISYNMTGLVILQLVYINLLMNIVFAVVNYIYYNHRAELFVN